MAIKEIKLTRGVPPTESFPTAQLIECSRAALENYGPEILQYGGGGGFRLLRSTLAAQAGISEDRVVIGQGSLLLQDFIARSLLKAGSLAFVENPTYDRTVLTLRRPCADVRGIPMEADGLDVDFLSNQLRMGARPVLVYTIPDFQNPSGTVLSTEKRKRIVELSDEYGFWIIEDVPYRQLRYRGTEVPAFFDLAPQRTIQMSSYSKLIGPGLRVGYAIMPDALAGSLLRFVEEAYICPTFLVQAMVYEFIQRGWLAENIAKLKALYPPRLDAMLTALDENMGDNATWFRPEGGFFVGMTVKKDISQAALLAASRKAGLQLTDGRAFYTDETGERFVRLPFCALTPDEIREGIARLAQVIREMPETKDR